MNHATLLPALLLASALATPALAAGRQQPAPAPTPVAAPAPAPAPEARPYLGVVTGEVSAAIAAQLRLEPDTGLMVESVTEDSAAAKAGLRQYDILLELDDQILVSSRQLTVLLRARKPGDTVRLEVLRGGERLVLEPVLTERPERLGRMLWTPRDAPLAPLAPLAPSAEPGAPVPPDAPRTGAVREIIIHREAGEPMVIRVPSGEEVGAMAMEIAAAVQEGVGRVVEDIDLESIRAQVARASAEGGTIEIDTEAIRQRIAMLRERLADLESARAEDMARVASDHAEGVKHVTMLRMSNARHVYDGPEGHATLETVEGSRRLVVKDPAGTEVFSGPVDTAEQRAALPDIARTLLEKLESARFQYHFQGDGATGRIDAVASPDLSLAPLGDSTVRPRLARTL